MSTTGTSSYEHFTRHNRNLYRQVSLVKRNHNAMYFMNTRKEHDKVLFECDQGSFKRAHCHWFSYTTKNRIVLLSVFWISYHNRNGSTLNLNVNSVLSGESSFSQTQVYLRKIANMTTGLVVKQKNWNQKFLMWKTVAALKAYQFNCRYPTADVKVRQRKASFSFEVFTK